jgi:alpha-glucosidase
MRWNSDENAGFTEGEPWLPVSRDHAKTNVEAQREDPRSMLTLHRRLLALRRSEGALSVGSYSLFEVRDDLLAYVRKHGGRRFLVALNFGDGGVEFESPSRGRVSLSTHLDREGEEVAGNISLRPNEGVVVEVGWRG